MTYVTGSHSAKVGFEMQRGHFWRGDNNDVDRRALVHGDDADGTSPAFVTIQAPVAGWQNDLNYNLGIYAQDRWTMKRLTLSGGVRLDALNESTEPFTAAPHRWLPNRNISFGAVENVPNWKDINPRVSAAYDLFGNGKTAAQGQREPRRRAGFHPLCGREQPREHAHHARPGRRVWRRCQQQLRSGLRPHESAPRTASVWAG